MNKELKAKIIDDKLVIEIPVNKPLVSSKSGKTLVVASSYGNQKTDALIGGKQIIIGVNAYIYPN
jgi:hypothetical protein